MKLFLWFSDGVQGVEWVFLIIIVLGSFIVLTGLIGLLQFLYKLYKEGSKVTALVFVILILSVGFFTFNPYSMSFYQHF